MVEAIIEFEVKNSFTFLESTVYNTKPDMATINAVRVPEIIRPYPAATATTAQQILSNRFFSYKKQMAYVTRLKAILEP